MEETELQLQTLIERKVTRRRKLLPLIIKIFIWIFIVFGMFVPLIFLMALFQPKANYEMSFFGLATHDPFSNIGLLIGFLFLFNGAAALALWTEKKWAFNLAIADAILGIIVCVAVIYNQGERVSNYGLELIFLLPYLIWLIQKKKEWENF